MTVVRDLMTADPHYVRDNQTLVEAAEMMRDLNVGALPVCAQGGRLTGIVTDRDIVVKCLAHRHSPGIVRASDLAEGPPVTVGPNDDIREALDAMQSAQVRRLPVVDGGDLVGIISQADIALSLTDAQVGQTVRAISSNRPLFSVGR